MSHKSKMRFYAFWCFVYILMFVWWSVIRPLGSWPGRDFPAEHELQYSQGKLGSVSEKMSRNYTATTMIIYGTYERGKYYCSHTPKHHILSCLSKDSIDQYVNKPVRVGWYLPKPYLWFDNPYRQVVTLEVDGETVISYQDTLETIAAQKSFEYKVNTVVVLLCLLGLGYLIYIPIAYFRQLRLNTKES